MKRKIIVGVILAAIVVVGVVLHKSDTTKENTTKNANSVLLSNSDITEVKKGSVANVISFTGDLTPLNQVVISSEVDAQVLKVLVSEGQLVQKGQVLAILDNTDLKQALTGQQAVLATSQAKNALDKKKLDKQKDLYEQGFISKFAYDELLNNYQVSREDIHQQQAALERAQKQLSDTVIKAPFTGYIYEKDIDSGQLASKNSKLFALANLDQMQIKAPIPSDQINSIKVNQSVSFNVETNKQVYTGVVCRVNPVAETGTRAYMIYINFDNHEAKLKAGQFVKGQIVLANLDNTLYLPTDSIKYNESLAYILYLNNGVVESRVVNPLLSNALNNTTAVSGVSESSVVLKGNVLTVKIGDKVKIVD